MNRRCRSVFVLIGCPTFAGDAPALRSHPRDTEALHKAEKKELLAKIGDLTMQIEVLQIAREYLGKTLPDANS
jgi:hypothetical protein